MVKEKEKRGKLAEGEREKNQKGGERRGSRGRLIVDVFFVFLSRKKNGQPPPGTFGLGLGFSFNCCCYSSAALLLHVGRALEF